MLPYWGLGWENISLVCRCRVATEEYREAGVVDSPITVPRPKFSTLAFMARAGCKGKRPPEFSHIWRIHSSPSSVVILEMAVIGKMLPSVSSCNEL